MGWEERRGRLYYYAKERDGSQIVSRYLGAGDLARFSEMIETSRRKERELNREAWRLEVAAMKWGDRDANAVFAAADELMEAALLAAGFHKHKGQWRQKRCLRSKK